MSKKVSPFKSQSTAMRRVYEEIEDYAKNGLNCVFFGPRGSGKEILANFYVAKYREARQKTPAIPFHSLDCAGLTHDLAQSELFGHVEGAFTGATASKEGLFQLGEGGIIFLDELGELPRSIQANLLRALDPGQGRRVGEAKSYDIQDVTVICATEQPEKTIHPALLDRLEGRIKVPGLDERSDDIPAAVEYFTQSGLNRRVDKKDLLLQLIGKHDLQSEEGQALVQEIASRIAPIAQSQEWPGNLRTLRINTTLAVIRAKKLSSVRAFATDAVEYFCVHLGQYSRPRGSLNRGESSVREDSALKKPNRPFEWVGSDDILRIMPGISEENKVLLLSFLNETGGHRFKRKNLQAYLKAHGKKTTNPRSWLEKMCRVDPATQRALLCQEGLKKDVYRRSSEVSAFEKGRSSKQTFLPLPLDVIWRDSHRRHLNEMCEILTTARILFVSGKQGVGKTVTIEALGTELSSDRAVHYYPFGDHGMAWFLQFLEETLRDRRVTFSIAAEAETMVEKIERLRPKISRLFTGKKCLLILDNVNVLVSPEDKEALLAMVRRWTSLTFILVGEKLANSYLFQTPKDLSVVEYLIDPKSV
jgi:DNA-binding NtrC family response regulator